MALNLDYLDRDDELKFREENSHLSKVKNVIKEEEKRLGDELQKKIKDNDLKSPLYQKIADEELSNSYLNLLSDDLIKLDKLKYSPYSARMDFQYDGEDEIQKIYIGEVPYIFGTDAEELNIYDWRSPIGDVYYKGGIGPCEVVVKDRNGKLRTIKGKSYLKRSIEIEKGQITRIQDLEVVGKSKEDEKTIADKNLIELLNKGSDTKLKNIIASIQKDQNDIIREDISKVVFIQGCAGSGKSTIALHRISYLIYSYNLKGEDILVIAPNKLFLNYISTTLPELDVENALQVTYKDFAEKVIGEKIPVEYDLNRNNEKVNQYEDVLKMKGSLQFKDIINTYAESLLIKAVPTRDLSIYDKTLYTYKDLQNMFMVQFGGYKLNERIERFKEYLKKQLKDKKKELVEEYKEELLNQLNLFKKQAEGYKSIDDEISVFAEEIDKNVNRMERHFDIIVGEYLNSIKEFDAIEHYLELITNIELLQRANEGRLDDKTLKRIVEFSSKGFTEQDVAGILYLFSLLNNTDSFKYKHIAIDESQDLSPFEIFTLKLFSDNSSFTIVGDINQSIVPFKQTYNINTVKKVFDYSKNLKIYNIKRSYRSTYEIVMFARELIKYNDGASEYLPEPLMRKGDKPLVIEKENDEEIYDRIIDIIKEKYHGKENIAIISKTVDGCERLYENLKSRMSVNLISDDMKEYKGGISIIPAYLTKGLEFDIVIIADADKDTYSDTLMDRNLLYVQITRALHNVYILSKGELTPIIEKIDFDLYDREESARDKNIKLNTIKELIIETIKDKFGSVPYELEIAVKKESDNEKLKRMLSKVAISKDIKEIM